MQGYEKGVFVSLPGSDDGLTFCAKTKFTYTSENQKIGATFITQFWIKNGVLFCIFKPGVMTTVECLNWVVTSKDLKATAVRHCVPR